jgi:DNA-binding response OmpR family regulator
MLTELLKHRGLRVTTCATSIAALHAIKTGWFDLYLLDAYLPDIDGFDLCRRIREFDQRTPILFYSGAARKSDIQQAMAAGANTYVVKPEIKGLLEQTTYLLRRQLPFCLTPPRSKYQSASPHQIRNTSDTLSRRNSAFHQ